MSDAVQEASNLLQHLLREFPRGKQGGGYGVSVSAHASNFVRQRFVLSTVYGPCVMTLEPLLDADQTQELVYELNRQAPRKGEPS